ncbi:MAG: GC-type dockerin domain-anchored protein [Phycisphaerales bacterium]
MNRKMMMAVLAGSLAGTASAQIELHRVFVDDLSDFSGDNSGANSLYIGNQPLAVAFDGTDLYVAGFRNGTSPWVQIGHVIDVFAGGANRSALIDFSDPLNPTQSPTLSSRRVVPDSRGYNSLDWIAGKGLIAQVDVGSTALGSAMAWDTETQQTPIVIGSQSTAERGLGVVAWDPGPDGNGYDTDGDGLSDGPVASLLFQPIDPVGPIGVSLPDMSVGLGDAVYASAPVPPEGQGPILEFAPNTTDRDGLGGTFWRGFDFSPNGQWIVASADSDLVIAQRDLLNFVFARQVVQGPSAPFVLSQNVTFLDNYNGQDVIVHNTRPTTVGGQAFSNIVNFYNTAGTELTVSIFDETGATFTFPDGVGVYDFAWHEPSQTLVVLDGGARLAHFFRPTPAGGDRLCADANDDGVVDPSDFTAWVAAYNQGSLLADANDDGVVDPSDFTAWVAAYNQGLGGPTCG